jgi:hypothetical protein
MASSSCADSPPAYASYDVLVHQLAVLRPASFRPPLAGWPLPFASSLSSNHNMVFDGDLPTEDFHLISSCPCWAYTSCSSSHLWCRTFVPHAAVQSVNVPFEVKADIDPNSRQCPLCSNNGHLSYDMARGRFRLTADSGEYVNGRIFLLMYCCTRHENQQEVDLQRDYTSRHSAYR